MSVLRALIINILLSLLFCFGLLNCTQTEHYRTTRMTTTTTPRPFIRSPGLSLPMRYKHPPKCVKEVPAVFFQYEKDVKIVGNSTLSPYFNVIEVCCRGYKRYDYDWSICVPDCGNKCLKNGFCLEGGICKCFDEFVLNHRSDCVPTCPLGCPNGHCYLNGTSVCDRGYELDATKKFCIPECEPYCGRNEVCVAPNNCTCADGYAKAMPDPHSMGCQPICIPDCGYGYCVGPNRCQCFHGFRQRENSSACEIDDCYLRCENGFCVNRTTCLCQNGYKFDLNTTSCLPDCGDDCENGVCISPGVCRCFNGYVHNGAKCEAVCEFGCGYYGKCIAPNVCGCSIIDGPYNSFQHCKRGSCTSKGRCRCEDGTTRFLNQCMEPDRVTTYATMHYQKLNETFMAEFDLLIGKYFMISKDVLYSWV